MKDQLLKIKPQKFSYFLSLFLLFAFLFLTFDTVYADTMKNTNYSLEMGNLNSFSGKPTNSSYKLGNTGGQTGGGLYSSGSGQNYKIRSGFEYIKSVIPFAFSISQTAINFGSLTASNPITRTNTITVSNNSAYGYTILAFENHQLMNSGNGTIIPNTSCDNGTCTETTSSLWSSNLTYGFGYRCDNVSGADCSSTFNTANFYEQFADNSLSKSAQAVMTGTIARSNTSQITYKVNISGSQPAGLYTNVVFFIAAPKY